ncbi:MAG: hypothetical protein NC237_03940 [Eubacterium sp.]|nr:hypothetical protein [Eubacterium sp.]MCM1417648.1 hypothetical protein [Roseburia sp.]
MANRNNLLFRRLVLVAVGKIKTGMTSEKLEKSIFYRKKPDIPADVSTMIRYYRANPKGKDEDIAVTQLFLQQCPRTYREFLKRLFCGEMSLDISPSTVQRIFGKKERKKE